MRYADSPSRVSGEKFLPVQPEHKRVGHQHKKAVFSNSLLLVILLVEMLFIGVLHLTFPEEALAGGLIQTLIPGRSFQNIQQIPPAATSNDPLPVLLGIYPSDALQVTCWELENMDAWLEEEGIQAGISLAGTYMDIEFHNPEYNVPAELDSAWDAGYTPFINLTAYQHTAAEVSDDPAVEEKIREWASAYAEWSARGQRRAFIAPLQEMNGGWVRYGMDPENFKRSFLKIRQIFREEGVAEDAVSWVFSPNGWSEEGHEFERYYPGDAYVDVVGFSSVNFGACPGYIGNWDTYDLVIQPYLERMQKMAPGKPIFLTQLATVNVGENGPDDILKNVWLLDTYTRLAAFPDVRAVLYFNRLKSEGSITNCRPVDWRIFDDYAGVAYDGFLEAVRSPRFKYWAPESAGMSELAFAMENPGNFLDVWPAEPFSGKEDPVCSEWIEILDGLRVAPGCFAEEYSILGTSITNHYFCPQTVVTRADFAHFLALALHGPQVNLPTATSRFTDLPPDYWVSPWVEQLVQDGLQLECSPGLFCPDLPVTRAGMTALLADAFFLPEVNNPEPAIGLFNDLPANHPLAGRVEQMVSLGKSEGYSETEYCPGQEITRAELAFALVSTFELYQPEKLSWYQAELQLVNE